MAANKIRDVLNSAIQSGLIQGKNKRGRSIQKSYRLGGERNLRWDKALEAAAAIEDEELGRKFSLRKCNPGSVSS